MRVMYTCPVCLKTIFDEDDRELRCEFCRSCMRNSKMTVRAGTEAINVYWAKIRECKEFNEALYKGRLAFEDTPEEQAKWQEEMNKIIEKNKAAQRELRYHVKQCPGTGGVRCPHCNSDQITTGARGWKWTTGFIGSGKTVNRCANCGHTWEPKKR